MTFEQASERLLALKIQKEALENQRSDLLKKLGLLKAEYELCNTTMALIQEASTITLETISLKINTIVTNAIKAVLPDPYDFDLGFKIAYGKLSTDMRLVRDGKVYDIKEMQGDGVVDIVAFALRVAVLCLDKRNLRRLLILDEPCGALSVDYQPLLGKLLVYLSEQLSIQVVMVAAHGSNLEIDGDNVKYFKIQ